MKKAIFILFLSVVIVNYCKAQSQITTTGNNTINTSNPYQADIVIGSDANGGTRHDASIMWWSYGSASRISATNDVFKFSVFNTTNPNVSLAATVGQPSFFQGNLGIGSILPYNLLYINSTMTPNTSQLRIGSGDVGSLSALNYAPDNTSIGFDVDYSNGTWLARNSSVAWLYKVNGTLRIIGSAGNTVNSSAPQNNYFTVNLANGNIGVGTVTPDQKLTVNGTIHASSVKVDLGIPQPDYVFNKDYRLPTLAETKAYIIKNHHLQGIPSATDAEKNGIDLGTMNTLLLKKIEELTMYLIEIKKDNTKLKKRIDKIEHIPSNQF